MGETAKVVLETPRLVIAHYQHICVVIPRAQATVEGVQSIRDALFQLGTHVDSGIGMLFIVAVKVAPPAGPARNAAAEMFRAARPYLKVLAAQMEGSGFAAAAKRSVFTWATSHMLGKTPVRAASELAGATDWLHATATTLGVSCPSSSDLQAYVNSARDGQ